MFGGGFIRRPSPGTVLASLALLVALGGTSVAAVSVTLPKNSVGNAQLKANAVTSNKVTNGSLLKADFKAGQLPAGTPGPAGPAGPAGPSGPAGQAATALWASVDATGTLVRNKGAASALRLGDGSYQVIFSQDVTGCVYLATLGAPAAPVAPPSGEVSTAPRPAIAAGVQVTTSASNGVPADRPFFLSVFC